MVAIAMKGRPVPLCGWRGCCSAENSRCAAIALAHRRYWRLAHLRWRVRCRTRAQKQNT